MIAWNKKKRGGQEKTDVFCLFDLKLTQCEQQQLILRNRGGQDPHEIISPENLLNISREIY